jgi:hypothetical protein
MADKKNPRQNNFDTEYSLVREALVREIGKADRWSAVVDAWEALLHVRRMAGSMLEERERFEPSQPECQGAKHG